ncbi:MAG TPA: tetratricopeptide repeat protein [Kofleriaceae bacterium]|nr:tetratricopeptide repeat protein [Kofleriaceae bacterium]
MSLLQRIKHWVSGEPSATALEPATAPEEAALSTLVAESAAIHNRARAKMARKQWSAALLELEQVIAQLPISCEARLDRGVCHLHLQDARAARIELSRAIALASDGETKALAYLSRAEAHHELGDPQAAIEDAERAGRMIRVPDLSELVARFRRALGDRPEPGPPDPGLIAAHLEEGWALQEDGALIDALVAFDDAIALAPEDSDAYYGRGVVNCKLQRHAQALADIDRAIELVPCHPGALTERGLLRAESGDFDGAMRDYDLAIQVNPGYATAYFNKGSALAMQGRFPEAIPHLDVAIRLDPDTPEVYFNRGQCHAELGRHRRALADLSTFLRLRPAGYLAEQARKTVARLEHEATN